MIHPWLVIRSVKVVLVRGSFQLIQSRGAAPNGESVAPGKGQLSIESQYPLVRFSSQWGINPLRGAPPPYEGQLYILYFLFPDGPFKIWRVRSSFWIRSSSNTYFLSKGQWTYGPTFCLSIDTRIRSKRYKVVYFWVYLLERMWVSIDRQNVGP